MVKSSTSVLHLSTPCASASHDRLQELSHESKGSIKGPGFDFTLPCWSVCILVPVATDDEVLDLTSADVLGATVFEVLPTMGAYSGNVSLALAPGWYALAFGAGKFGADSVVGVDMIMPSLAVDLDPQLPFTALQAGNPFGTPPQFLDQQASPEFFATPEPASLLLLAIGLAA